MKEKQKNPKGNTWQERVQYYLERDDTVGLVSDRLLWSNEEYILWYAKAFPSERKQLIENCKNPGMLKLLEEIKERTDEEYFNDFKTYLKDVAGADENVNTIAWEDFNKAGSVIKIKDPALFNWLLFTYAPRHGHGYSIRYMLTHKPRDSMNVPAVVVLGRNYYNGGKFKCSACHRKTVPKTEHGPQEGIFLRIELIGEIGKSFQGSDVIIFLCNECLESKNMFDGIVDLGDHGFTPLGLK